MHAWTHQCSNGRRCEMQLDAAHSCLKKTTVFDL
jgi:hypothetical protein